MARTWHPSARFAALGLAAAFVVAAAPAANAQIPGTNPRAQVFPVDDTRIEIAVDPVDLEAGTVRVVVQNNFTSNITCAGLDGGPAGTVLEAGVVARSVDFYTNYPQTELADLVVGIVAPAVTVPPENIDLGSAVALLPGSVAGLVNPEYGILNDINSEFVATRLAGEYGRMGNSFTIPAQQATTFNVVLDHPSEGQRADFQTAVFMTCAIGGTRYVFHAYENDQPPALPAESSGSIGAGSLGS